MLGKISVFFVLVEILLGLFVYPLYAQNTQTASEIAKLNEQIKNLNEQIQKLNQQIQQLEKENYEHVNLKLKNETGEWMYDRVSFYLTLLGIIIGAVGFCITVIGILAVIGGKSFIDKKVADAIAGERDNFYKALEDIEASQQEIESSKREMKDIQYNQVRQILSGGYPNESLAKYLSLELILRALEEAELDEVELIQSAIYTLGLKKYQSETQANESVQTISNYLDLSQTRNTLTYSIATLGKIGTEKASDELSKFYESLPEDVVNIRCDILEALGEIGALRLGKQEIIPLIKKFIFIQESLHIGWRNGISALKKIWVRNTETRETVEATLKEIYEKTQIKTMKDYCLEVLETMSAESVKWAKERKAT